LASRLAAAQTCRSKFKSIHGTSAQFPLFYPAYDVDEQVTGGSRRQKRVALVDISADRRQLAVQATAPKRDGPELASDRRNLIDQRINGAADDRGPYDPVFHNVRQELRPVFSQV
jgi:hypothetical protein